MEPVGIFTALTAILVIATRAPLLIVPTATVAFYHWSLKTLTRVRLVGVLLAGLGIPIALTAPAVRAAHGASSIALESLGWIMAAAALWLLLAPRNYQTIAFSMLDSVMDDTTLRAVGALGAGIGLVLGWVAFAIL
jgi:hypothetical protein